jgi:hypothetical protein
MSPTMIGVEITGMLLAREGSFEGGNVSPNAKSSCSSSTAGELVVDLAVLAFRCRIPA